MRKINKWLIFMLTIVMAVNAFGLTAVAAENVAPLDLEFFQTSVGGVVQVDILATAGQTVADGKLVVTFDSADLLFDSVEIGSAWANAANVTLSHSVKNGKVILAFAGLDAAGEGVLFSIRFSGAVGDTSFQLDGKASYITGTTSVPTVGGTFCPSENFADIQNAVPLIHEAVDYMVGMGYMNGMSGTMFGPNVDLNRAMMVTILYRIAGSPAVDGTASFTDVPAGQFYTAPVAWAVEKGITNGLSASLFAPGKSLTRQELVTFLYRFAGVMGYDRSATTDLSAYTDANKVQPYAVEAFQWAVASGVINGTSETTLSPENNTTRAQVCIMVSRLLTAQN